MKRTAKSLSKNNYYIKIPTPKGYSAGSKAVLDSERIFELLSISPLQIIKEHESDDESNPKSIVDQIFRKVQILIKLLRFIFHSRFTKTYKDSNVIYQVFSYSYDLIYSFVLRMTFSNGKRILILHDLETIRIGGWKHFFREKLMIRNFTHIIAHSDEMKEFLKKTFKFKGEIFVLGLYDYLCSLERNENKVIDFPINKKFDIVYAGTLTEERCGFLYTLETDSIKKDRYQLLLFGENFLPKKLPSFVRLEGSYNSYELPSKLCGHFGLIWYGTKIDEIDGKLGEYLRYCAPHKTSLYIVSGLPIICWSKSATAKLVEYYDIGFSINSLRELNQKLENVNKETYFKWRKNTSELAKKLLRGENLMTLIKEILD